MDIYVYNQDLVINGIIDTFISMIWIRRYSSMGTFEIVCPSSDYILGIVDKNTFIERADSNEVGYVKSIRITQDDGVETITISGCLIEGLLGTRVVYDVSDVSSFMTLIERNSSNCIDTSRNIPRLSINKTVDTISKYIPSIKYKSLSEYAEAVCLFFGCGLSGRMIHSDTENSLELSAYYGTDRSVNQTENPQVILSNEYGSFVETEYVYDENDAATTIYGHANIGSGVDYYGAAPEYIEGSSLSGFERIEKSAETEAVTTSMTSPFFDGYDENGDMKYTDKEFKLVDYQETLKNLEAECQNNLVNVTDTVTGIAETAAGYKKLWDLGDIVTVSNSKWGVNMTERVTEVTENYESNSVTFDIVFGDPEEVISDILKGE